jgi:anthranilate/para-aminobenzoate synthase component I
MVFGDGRYNFQAGAGIVAQSIAAREHDEIIAKSAVLRRSMELAGEGL